MLDVNRRKLETVTWWNNNVSKSRETGGESPAKKFPRIAQNNEKKYLPYNKQKEIKERRQQRKKKETEGRKKKENLITQSYFARTYF